MKRFFTIFLLAAFAGALTAGIAQAKVYKLSSPDGRTSVEVDVQKQITWSVRHGGRQVLAPSAISLTAAGNVIGYDARIKSARTEKIRGTVAAPFWRQAVIEERYNELELTLPDGWSLTFRAYDGEGVAYRFSSTSLKKGDRITAEQAEFNFDRDYTAYVPYNPDTEHPFATSFESKYTVAPLSAFRSDALAFSPLLVCLDGGLRVEVTDADIESYPGMFLKKGSRSLSLEGSFAPVPAATRETPRRGQVVVDRYSDDLAVIRENASKKAPRHFPWRVLAIAESDADLPVNNLVYLLASPSRVKDISWIKPGKVAWDWWNDWNITGVDFEAGINTRTYKHYIDFAAENGLEYVVLDEGWSAPLDIMKLNPAIDLKELAKYASSKGVDLVLWAVSYVLDKDLEKACKTYSKMGIKGFKVDFMNRDDQLLEKFLEETAADAAERKLVIMYHGIHKPTGLCRTYPNVLNYEGVYGLEQGHSIGGRKVVVSNDVNLVYTRMIAGAMDYTPGAMRNRAFNAPAFVKGRDPSACYGTRCHQLALFPLFEAPVQMLCDSPTQYRTEPECTAFITKVPTVWDETVGIAGEIGKYAAVARRKGATWWLGAITNWDAREIVLPTGFLGDGEWQVESFEDAPDADVNAEHYVRRTFTVKARQPLKVKLAPGGGFAAALTRVP